MKDDFGISELTVKPGVTLKVNFTTSNIEYKEKLYSFNPVGEAAQELIVLDGLENWIKQYI